MIYMEQPASRGDSIAAAIRGKAEARSMTLRDLAFRAEISTGTLRRRMANEGSFLLPELERVCEVLDLDVVEVVRARGARRAHT